MMGLNEVLPFFAMVMVEFIQVGLFIISKVAMSQGMSNFIYVLYTNVLASLILLPSSLLLHGRSHRPPLTFSILPKIFLLAVFGLLTQNFEFVGVKLSSPALGTAMLNLIPGLTFVLAIIFRMEKFNLRSSPTLAKSVGTIIAIAGACAITFYKGPRLVEQTFPSKLFRQLHSSQQSDWILGGFLLAASSVMGSVWYILQASILKKYPAELIVVLLYSFFISIMSATICLAVERDPAAWRLNPSIRLVAVLYSGVLGSALRIGVNSWCLNKKGPVFVCIFKPLGIVIATAVAVIWSGDSLFLGSLLGAIVIVFGFYLVIWGKAQEEKVDGDVGLHSSCESSNSHKLPLLQSHVEET